MRLTKTGIGLNLVYLVGALACVIAAQFIGDPKGQYVILQLPVVLQHGVLLSIDATHVLSDRSWAFIYVVLGLPMMVVLAGCGYLIERVLSNREDRIQITGAKRDIDGTRGEI